MPATATFALHANLFTLPPLRTQQHGIHDAENGRVGSPRASVTTATIVNVGFLTSMRKTIANILKQSPHEDAPLGQYHGITERRISPLGAHQLGYFRRFQISLRFHFLQRPGAIAKAEVRLVL